MDSATKHDINHIKANHVLVSDVIDLQKAYVISLKPSDTIADLWEQFFKNDFRGFVLQETQDGPFLGFVVLRDVLIYALRLFHDAETPKELEEATKEFLATPIKQIQDLGFSSEKEYITVSPGTNIRDLIHHFSWSNYHAIVIDENKVPKAVISPSFLLRWLKNSYHLHDAFKSLKIRECNSMDRDLAAVRSTMSCEKAYSIMATYRLVLAGVVKRAEGVRDELCDVISESDILILGKPGDVKLSRLSMNVHDAKRVEYLRHRSEGGKPITAHPDDKLNDVVNNLIEKKIHKILIFDTPAENSKRLKPFGVFSVADVYKLLDRHIKHHTGEH